MTVGCRCTRSRIRGRTLACLVLAIGSIDLLGTDRAFGADENGWDAQINKEAPSKAAAAPASKPATPVVLNRKAAPAPAPAAASPPPAEKKVEKTPVAAKEESKPSSSEDAELSSPEPPDAELNRVDANLGERFCRVAADAVVAAKLKEEEARANALKAQIATKLEELEKATEELKTWIKRREEFKSIATENLVTVYSEMDAEAAAQRLTVVGEPTAAAIIMKLSPKIASAVLGEMPPEVAGKITAYMAGAAAVDKQRGGKAGATE